MAKKHCVFLNLFLSNSQSHTMNGYAFLFKALLLKIDMNMQGKLESQ